MTALSSATGAPTATGGATAAAATAKRRILVIDDERQMCELVVEMLRPRGIDVVVGDHAADIVAQLDESRADVLLTDLRLPRIDGLDLCRQVAAARPDIPVVVMTGFGSLENAIDAIRAGAYDFVTKPVDAAALQLVVERAARHRALKAEVRLLRAQAGSGSAAGGDGGGLAGLVGESAAMRQVRDVVHQVADLDVTVLITGESGTGKEVVARALHALSRRREKPFVAVNCAALPEHLLESQLFGHVRGAFTDARADRQGLLQQAAGGTLLLDELGELPLPLQPKLLRVLEDRRVRPVGADHEIPIDVRFVVSTNRDLEQGVADGSFREDLFYRVNVVHVDLPPLRVRADDILRLAHLFITRAAERMNRPVKGLSPAAAAAILASPWPGNVRELQNAMERAVALTQYQEIVVADLPRPAAGAGGAAGGAKGSAAAAATELLPLDEVEKRHVLAVLDHVQWSRRRAASILGIDPKTLYRRLLQWGVEAGKTR